jgi:hypothetical protein
VTPGNPFICQAFGLRHDRDRRLIEVREDIDRQLRDSKAAENDKNRRQSKHEQPVLQGLRDEKVEHPACSSTDLIEEFDALRHDALAGL